MYRGLRVGGRSTTVVDVVVVEVVGATVVVVGLGGLEVGAIVSVVTPAFGSTPAVEDGEHPEATRMMAAQPAKPVAEASNSRRTESPNLLVKPSATLARVPPVCTNPTATNPNSVVVRLRGEIARPQVCYRLGCRSH